MSDGEGWGSRGEGRPRGEPAGMVALPPLPLPIQLATFSANFLRSFATFGAITTWQ